MGVNERKVVISSENASNKEFVTITDIETGEIIDQFWKERQKSPSGRPPGNETKNPYFFKVYTSNWRNVLKKKQLTPYETGVFMMCLAFVGWESNFLIHPKTKDNLNCSSLAALLSIERTQLYNTMQTLNKKGLIAVVKCGDGQSNHYMLNSNIVFWGNKIKDKAEHERFTQDCPYDPPIKVKYKEREGR